MQDRSAAASLRQAPRALAAWLLLCAAMVFAMAVIGAITRLTESGLSIMEWAPLSGALPPLSQQEWERLFELYRQIPEYQLENAGMSLAEFKNIFWWEWIHRFWGRLIGAVFLLPFLWFLWRGQVPSPLKPHLAALFLLGGLQGALGWFMVASGFSERSDVSQYRLAAHLALALFIYGYLFWLWLRLAVPGPARNPANAPLRRGLLALLALLAITLVSGALVAGTNAGLTYNSFPLMDGRLIPNGYARLEPFVLNWFETIAAIQFNHRLLATLSVLASLTLCAWGWRRVGAAQRPALALLAAAAAVQFLLGVSALLTAVPVWLGALHQAGAILLLTALLNCLYRLRTV